MGRPNLSRETKFSGANGDREIFIFPVQLTTSRIGILTRLIYTDDHRYMHRQQRVIIGLLPNISCEQTRCLNVNPGGVFSGVGRIKVLELDDNSENLWNALFHLVGSYHYEHQPTKRGRSVWTTLQPSAGSPGSRGVCYACFSQSCFAPRILDTAHKR